MKKIITTLSAGVLAVAFSSASFSGHHESGDGMVAHDLQDGMPPTGAPPIGDGMPPTGAPPMGG